MHDNLTFFKAFLKDKYIAYAFPTSPFGVRRICKHVDFSQPRTIVEYGPGTGVVTKELLRQLSPDSSLILIEKNEELFELLRKTIRDPRVRLFHDSAENVEHIMEQCGIDEVDCVISGIPFSFLSPEARQELMEATDRILGPSGRFIVYQVLDLMGRELPKVFSVVRRDFEPLNLPPLFFFIAEKTPAHSLLHHARNTNRATH